MLYKILIFLLFSLPCFATVPTYKSFTEAKAAANVTSIEVTTPSGTSIGDLLVTVIATDGDNSASLSGWTVLANKSNSTDSYCGVLYKVLTAAADSSYTFNLTDSETVYAAMLHFVNVNYDNPIDVNDDAIGSDDTPLCPDVTTTVADTLILRVFGADDDDVTADTGYPSGHTGITIDHSGSNGGPSGGAAYETLNSAGSPGTAAFTMDAAEEWVAHTIAIVGVPDGNNRGGRLKPPRGTVLSHSSLARGLVGFWLMNEGSGNTVADLSGNGHTGTFSGDAVSWTSGKYGDAVDLGGSDDIIAIPSTTTLRAAHVTVIGWHYPHTVSGDRVIASKHDANVSGWCLEMDGQTASFFINVDAAASRARVLQSDYAVNKWEILAGTYDEQNIKLYRNGNLIATTAYTTPISQNNNDLAIGVLRDTFWDYDGLISHVIYYNRALTASEIVQLCREPFCIFQPQNPMLAMGDVGGAPAPTGQIIIIQSTIPFLLIAGIVLAFFVRDKK